MPGFGNLTEELHQLTGFLPNVGGMGANPVALVGESLNFATAAAAIGAPSVVTLARRPATSTATVAANAFVPDVAGRYDTTVLVAGITKTYSVFVFPAAFLSTRVNPDPSGQSTPPRLYNRSHLMNFIQAGVTAAQLSTLETITPPPNLSLLGAIGNTSNF